MTTEAEGYSDEKTMQFATEIADRVDVGGPRVVILSATCQRCGGDALAGTEHEGVRWTAAAAVVREMAMGLAHHDDCLGPLQFETEPYRD